MTTRTMGTTAQTTLIAMPASAMNSAADQAAISQIIRNDQINGRPVQPSSWILSGGMLIIPNRGNLKVFAGDFIAVDQTTGWPILVSAISAANNAWVHT